MKTMRQWDVSTLEVPIDEDGQPVDISGCAVTLEFKAPGQPTFYRPGVAAGPVATYDWQPGEVAWWGLWKVAAHVVFPTGRPDVRTRLRTFEVEAILGPPPIWLRPEPVAAVALVPAMAVS